MIYRIRRSRGDTPSIPAEKTLVGEPPAEPQGSEGPTIVRTGVREVGQEDEASSAAVPEGSWCVLRPLGVEIGEPLLLSHGVPVDRFTVGTAGTWRLVGDDILDVHALMFFNGRCVFVWSVDWAHPVLVDDRPALGEWVELPEACILRMGSVAVACTQLHPGHAHAGASAPEGPPSTQRLPVAPPPDAHPTSVDPPREPEPSPPPAAKARDDEPTRIGIELPLRPAAADPVSVRSEVRARARDDEPTRLGVEVPARTVSAEPTRLEVVVPEPRGAEDTRRLFARLAGLRVRRGWLVGIVAAIISAGAVVGLVGALERARQSVTPLPAQTVEPPAPEPTSADEAPPPGIVVSTAAPRAVDPPLAAADAGARPRRSGDAGVTVDAPSLERAAVDAVQAGDLRTALTLYEKLSQEEPGNPAFASAAAMLRGRLGQGP